MRALLAFALVTLLAAGCTGGTSTSTTGVLTYQGNGSGSHDTTRDCGTQVRLTTAPQVGTGNVRVIVHDSSGAEKHNQLFTGPSSSGGSMTMSGAGGVWHMVATRSGEFTGQYSFTLTCN